MASKVAQITDAVLTEVNSLTTTTSFTASKTYNPDFDKRDETGVKVQLCPISLSTDSQTRSKTKDVVELTIGFHKRITIDADGNYNQTEVEDMMELVEEVLDGIRGFDVASPRAQQISCIADPYFWADGLLDYQVYFGLIRMEYHVQGTNN